jgi:hypothetical protein
MWPSLYVQTLVRASISTLPLIFISYLLSVTHFPSFAFWDMQQSLPQV